MKPLMAVAFVAFVLSGPAGAKPVYKCEENGKITYTDQPCTPGARAAELPGLIVTTPPTRSQEDLAREHDARMAQERAERDRDDAQWLKEHAERNERADRAERAKRERKARERQR